MTPERISALYQSSANNHLHECLEEIEKIKAEFSRHLDIHAMRLAAISAASNQNTEAARNYRIDRNNEYWTPAYGDVCAAVDREMALQARISDLEAEVRSAIGLHVETNARLTDLQRVQLSNASWRPLKDKAVCRNCQCEFEPAVLCESCAKGTK